MPSLVDSGLDKLIADGFRNQLVPGTLRRETAASVDDFGDAIAPAVATFTVEGIRDNFSAYYALANGVPETDVRILLIIGLIVPATIPVQDDKINIRGEWYQVRKVREIDPANASIVLQCFKIETPA